MQCLGHSQTCPQGQPAGALQLLPGADGRDGAGGATGKRLPKCGPRPLLCLSLLGKSSNGRSLKGIPAPFMEGMGYLVNSRLA